MMDYLTPMEGLNKFLQIPAGIMAGYENGKVFGEALGYDEPTQRKFGRMSAFNTGLQSTGSFIQTLRKNKEAEDRLNLARSQDYVTLPRDRYGYNAYQGNARDYFKKGGTVGKKYILAAKNGGELDYIDSIRMEEGDQVNLPTDVEFIQDIDMVDSDVEVYNALPEAEDNGMLPYAMPIQTPSVDPPDAPKGGTIAVSHNNPGNIKFGKFAAKYGARMGRRGTDGGNFAVFPDVETGLKAQRDLLVGKNYRNLTVDQAMRRWSNNGYGGEIMPTLKDKPMSLLSDAELQELQKAQIRREDRDMYKLIFND